MRVEIEVTNRSRWWVLKVVKNPRDVRPGSPVEVADGDRMLLPEHSARVELGVGDRVVFEPCTGQLNATFRIENRDSAPVCCKFSGAVQELEPGEACSESVCTLEQFDIGFWPSESAVASR